MKYERIEELIDTLRYTETSLLEVELLLSKIITLYNDGQTPVVLSEQKVDVVTNHNTEVVNTFPKALAIVEHMFAGATKRNWKRSSSNYYLLRARQCVQYRHDDCVVSDPVFAARAIVHLLMSLECDDEIKDD